MGKIVLHLFKVEENLNQRLRFISMNLNEAKIIDKCIVICYIYLASYSEENHYL